MAFLLWSCRPNALAFAAWFAFALRTCAFVTLSHANAASSKNCSIFNF